MKDFPATKKPPTLKREQLALQNMNVLQFFAGHVCLLGSTSKFQSGGSRDSIESVFRSPNLSFL